MFTSLTPGQTDAESPVDQTLMDLIRTNLDDLDGRTITNGDLHDHDGGDGAQIPQGGLNTALGSVNTTLNRLKLTLPGGLFGFYPQIKMSSTISNFWLASMVSSTVADGSDTPTAQNGWASYASIIELGCIGSGGTHIIYAQQEYIQASPPYKVGNKTWGHFLYLLVNAQGDIVASYEAEDPPYAYNGSPHNKKDSIERIQAVPHPFADYHDKDPAIDGLEIVLVDLSGHNTKQWKEDSAKQGKGILENMGHINKKGDIITPQELGIADIQGFTDKVKIRKV